MRLTNILLLSVLLIIGTYASNDCNICKRTVNLLVPASIKNVHFGEFFMNNACSRIFELTEQQRTTCRDWIKKNRNNIMEWNMKGEIADKMCEAVGKCGNKSFEVNYGRKIGQHLADLLPPLLSDADFDHGARSFCSKQHSKLGMETSECLYFIQLVRGKMLDTIEKEKFEEVFCNITGLCD
ncbi:hypothetical protein RCL1_003870 [Eukaryota sp. TZLM3-RCL]